MHVATEDACGIIHAHDSLVSVAAEDACGIMHAACKRLHTRFLLKTHLFRCVICGHDELNDVLIRKRCQTQMDRLENVNDSFSVPVWRVHPNRIQFLK